MNFINFTIRDLIPGTLHLGRIFLLAYLFAANTLVLANEGTTRLEEAPRHNLSKNAMFVRDTTGAFTIQDAVRMPVSQLTPLQSDLSLGFTKDVVWIRLALARQDLKDPTDWLLVVGQPVLRDARIYKPSIDRKFIEFRGTKFDSGSIVETFNRHPVFDISTDDLGEKIYWLRIESPTALNMSLNAVQHKVFLEQTGFENFIWGLIFGGYILTIIFYSIFWTWTKENSHILYTSYISINFLSALFSGGWPNILSKNMSSGILITTMGILISLSIYIGTKFTSSFIQLEKKNQVFNKAINHASTLIALLGLFFIYKGEYVQIMPVLQTYTMALISIFMIASIYFALNGDRKAIFFLFAFSFFYIGIIWRYLRNTAMIEPNFINENIYQIAAFIHMLVMSIGIFAGYNNLKKQKRIAEAKAESEAQLRHEQSEFLSLVSHEFRTPLTISGVSADNLLSQDKLDTTSKLRVEKIIRANERMSALIEEYLSRERLFIDSTATNIKKNDIVKICKSAIDDMVDHDNILLNSHSISDAYCNCDAALMRTAVSNLLQNSLKYSPEKTPITVNVLKTDSHLMISISDEGPGIPESEHGLIFGKFYRGRNQTNLPGAGLGLYLVKTIASRHGGSVSVRNLPKVGCEFIISIPI